MPKHHHTRQIPFGADNFLSVLEGLEGGFAIFVGIIAGLAFKDVGYNLVIMTAAIGIIVNAFNASAVRYTSEHYLDELDGHEKRSWLRAYFVPSFIEFITYLLVSAVAVLPLILVKNVILAVWLCILLTAIILYTAGAYRGKLLGRHAIRDGVEVMMSGLLIIAVGAFSGWVLSHLLV